MQRERALVAAALVLVALSVVAALALPGALAEREGDVRPTRLDLRESNVEIASVGGETATLSVVTHLAQSGGSAENVSIAVQAIDTDSRILVDTARSRVGALTNEREVTVASRLRVPREGGYDFRVIVYEDGERRAVGTHSVSGVGSLVPESQRTSVVFSAFRTESSRMPPITFTVASTENGRVTLDVSASLTNRGNASVEGLELVLRARQVDSNIEADRTAVEVGAIEPGVTATPAGRLTVPEDLNYHLDALLKRDGVVVATASAPATLDPSKQLPENETLRDVELDAGEFSQETGTPPRPDRPDGGPATTTPAGPGFGPLVAIVGIIGAILSLRRRQQ